MENIQVHSVLTFNKKVLGVRFTEGAEFFDMAIDSLKGVKKEHLDGFKTERLVEHSNLLITRFERETDTIIANYSSHDAYSTYIMANVLVVKEKRKKKDFNVTVEVENFHPIKLKMEKILLVGEFSALDTNDAHDVAKEFYAEDQGTDASQIKVVSVEEKVK
jgi:hypothetical protein